jgi:hypothetical protein
MEYQIEDGQRIGDNRKWLMTDAIRSCETSFLIRATRRNISEDDILHSHLRESLKSYMLQLQFRNLMNHIYPMLV